MAKITMLGSKPKTVYFKGPSAHRLHVEFEVADGKEIIVGQPVQLTTDGTVEPYDATADGAHKVIGYSIHNGKEEEYVTVATVGYAVIKAELAASTTPGPAKYKAPSTVTDSPYTVYENATTGTEVHGYIMDAGAEGDVVRVLIK